MALRNDSTIEGMAQCVAYQMMEVQCALADEMFHKVQVDLTLNITERKTGGLSAGGGISAQGHAEGGVPGFIGSCSYSQRNLFGLNQKLTATVELGQVPLVASSASQLLPSTALAGFH